MRSCFVEALKIPCENDSSEKSVFSFKVEDLQGFTPHGFVSHEYSYSYQYIYLEKNDISTRSQASGTDVHKSEKRADGGPEVCRDSFLVQRSDSLENPKRRPYYNVGVSRILVGILTSQRKVFQAIMKPTENSTVIAS